MRTTLPSGTPAELARPSSGEPPSRGLVLIPDIGSLRPLFDEMAQRLADDQGWVVCAFDLWPGRDDLPTLADRLEAGGTIDDARVLGDAAAAADLTRADEVAVVGFCMGGMYALKAAGTGRFVRAAAFYGMARVPEMWRSPTQGEPLEALARPEACPALAIVGTIDPWLPAATRVPTTGSSTTRRARPTAPTTPTTPGAASSPTSAPEARRPRTQAKAPLRQGAADLASGTNAHRPDAGTPPLRRGFAGPAPAVRSSPRASGALGHDGTAGAQRDRRSSCSRLVMR
jgi:carboxymethylenebutenolidase